MRRFVAMVLAVVMLVGVLPILASAAGSITQSEVETKLAEAQKIWKHGDKFGSRADDKAYEKNQCLGFVAVLFKYVFGASFPISSYPNAQFKAGTSGLENLTSVKHLEGAEYTSSALTTLLKDARPGDVLVVHKTQTQGNYGHVMMIRSVKSSGATVEVHDANWACSNQNTIKIRDYKAASIQSDYSQAATLYRYKNYSDGSTPAKTTITFSSLSVPGSLTVGQDGSLDGSITATNSKINSVKAEVINIANSSVALSAYTGGNFSVWTYGPIKGSKLDSDLNLGKLAAGTYYVRYTATTQDGTSASKNTSNFTVSPVSCNGNHTWGNWTTTKNAACGVAGERSHTCTKCGQTATEVIPALSHSWGDWETVEEAVCEEEGLQERVCELCGETETETIAALGHDYQVKQETEAAILYACTRCGDSYLEEKELPGEEDELPTEYTGDIGHFTIKKHYSDGLFWDVKSGDWFNPNVETAYSMGLMNGRGSNTFAPRDNMTVAEVVTLAARVHSIYYTGSDSFSTYDGGNWYDPYVNYARDNGIIYENYDFGRPATREQVVHILAKALPKVELTQTVDYTAFADSLDITYMSDVRLLSGAGVINGIRENGASYFKPLSPITRAQVAAIVGRMVQPSTRVGR